MNSKNKNVISEEDIDGRIDEIFGFDEGDSVFDEEEKPVTPEVHQPVDSGPMKFDTEEFAVADPEPSTPGASKEASVVEPDSPDLMLTLPEESGAVTLGIPDSGSNLDTLNAIVLSMDWEIDDKVMDSFIGEVGKLKELYKNDKFIFPLLQIHNSVGKYISARKARAHPESIKLLNSVFSSLEEVLGNKSLTDKDKTRLILEEVNKLKSLKKIISGATPQVQQEKPVAQPVKGLSVEVEGSGVEENSPGVDQNLVQAVVAELKKELVVIIREEFAKFKREM